MTELRGVTQSKAAEVRRKIDRLNSTIDRPRLKLENFEMKSKALVHSIFSEAIARRNRSSLMEKKLKRQRLIRSLRKLSGNLLF